jgi:TIR domain
MLRRFFPRRVKKWDAFISYAGEEREAVALPLAAALREEGYRVWLDQLELHLGDRMFATIANGIRKSQFGVIIFSASYLDKKWTNREFAEMVKLASDGEHTILPILHNISIEAVEARYPALADLYFGDTHDGVEEVADQIIRALNDPRSNGPSIVSPGVRRRFLSLLERDPSHEEILAFMRGHRDIIYTRLGIIPPERGQGARAIGGVSVFEWVPDFFVDSQHGAFALHPDLYVGDNIATSQSVAWKLLFLKTPAFDIFPDGVLNPVLADELKQLAALYAWLGDHAGAGLRQLMAEGVNLALHQFLFNAVSTQGIIVVSRRHRLTAENKAQLRTLNDSIRPTSVRTFDWLIESVSPLA